MSKQELIEKILEKELAVRNRILREFIPGVPRSLPFPKQEAYLRDRSKVKLARCGNRAAKTFTNCRDFAWKITRTHWYNEELNVFRCAPGWFKEMGSSEYELLYGRSRPRQLWMVGPTYEFVNGVMWDMYLSQMIPEWFIVDIKRTNQGNLDKVFFRNGDVLSAKTYSQQDTTKMGFAVDDILLDEMPKDQMLISELIMRTLDKDGNLQMGFTSLEVNEDVKAYVDRSCDSGTISLHQWSLVDNPHYRDNPDRLRRAMAEFANLSPEERDARLSGGWFKERPNKPVFDGLEPQMVDDFPIPPTWRQVRYVDPSSYVTGLAIFAENPEDGQWYCHIGTELTWKEAVKAEELVNRIEFFKPHSSFQYHDSVYDNAEAWFWAYAKSTGFRPCILKNRNDAIQKTRDAVAGGKVKFFRKGAALAQEQFRAYKFTDDGKAVVKKKDHVLDCIMYFCREIPELISQHADNLKTEHQLIYDQHRKAQDQKRLQITPNPGVRMWTQREIIGNRLRQRGFR